MNWWHFFLLFFLTANVLLLVFDIVRAIQVWVVKGKYTMHYWVHVVFIPAAVGMLAFW